MPHFINFKGKKKIVNQEINVLEILNILGQKKGLSNLSINMNFHSSYNKKIEERYEFLSPLYDNGSCVIFKVRDRYLNRIVLGKQLQLDNTIDNENVFVWEAKVLSYLHYPYIPTIYDFGRRQDNGAPVIIYRYIEGVLFSKILEDMTFTYRMKKIPVQSEAEAVKQRIVYFLKICELMDYVHSRGIVHCSLAPKMITLGKHRDAYVIHWRASHFSGDQIEDFLIKKLDEKYTAPELYKNKIALYSCDIYSLGKLLADIITLMPESEPLYDEEDEVYLHQDSRFRIDKKISAIIHRAIEPDVTKRYHSVKELQNDIWNYIHNNKISVYQESRRERLVRYLIENRYFLISRCWLIGMAVIFTIFLLFVNIILSNKEKQKLNLETEQLTTSIMLLARMLDQGFEQLIVRADFLSDVLSNILDKDVNDIKKNFIPFCQNIFNQPYIFDSDLLSSSIKVKKTNALWFYLSQGKTDLFYPQDLRQKAEPIIWESIARLNNNKQKIATEIIKTKKQWLYVHKQCLYTINQKYIGNIIFFVQMQDSHYILIEMSRRHPNREYYLLLSNGNGFRFKKGIMQHLNEIPSDKVLWDMTPEMVSEIKTSFVYQNENGKILCDKKGTKLVAQKLYLLNTAYVVIVVPKGEIIHTPNQENKYRSMGTFSKDRIITP